MPSSFRNESLWKTPRVFHRQVRFATTGGAGVATGGAYVPLPPCRLTHFAINHSASGAATANTTLIVDGLSDGSTGTTVFTQTDAVTDIPMRALGQPNAVDEGRAVTAATDGVEGGAFIKNGIYVKTIENDALAEAMVVDLWFERLRLETVTLVAQSGVDGSAVVTRTLPLNGAGNLLGIQFDFQNTPATADVIIKADNTSGETLFTSANSLTDFGPAALGIIGLDEANGVVAATDGIGGGQVFRTGLFFDVAQSDAYTSSNEQIVVYCWIRQ